MGQGLVSLGLVVPVVKIVYFASFKQCHRVTANLVGGAVVEIQLLRSPPDVDAALAHRCTVTAVDALVTVANEEQIIRPDGNKLPQKLERLRSEVLCLIDNDRALF